jgi:hypothetical protein
MPAAISAPYASTFRKASDLPQRVWDILNSHSRNANVILPQANKALVAELAGEPIEDCLWITCNLYSTVELVLACTPGDMGDYPVFIFTSLPSNQLTTEYLRPRIELLAEALRGEPGSIQRAYSVYSPSPITKLFVDAWTRITGVKNYKNEPYYAANITFCTRRSFINRQTSVHPSLTYDLRPAVATDIVHIAPLCHGFAAESVSLGYPPAQLSLINRFFSAVSVHFDRGEGAGRGNNPGTQETSLGSHRSKARSDANGDRFYRRLYSK